MLDTVLLLVGTEFVLQASSAGTVQDALGTVTGFAGKKVLAMYHIDTGHVI